jgi:hypothetical protein
MLCSKQMILPSKFNVKLQEKIWEAEIFGGGVRDLGQGGMIFLRGGRGGVSTPYQHPVAMYVYSYCL